VALPVSNGIVDYEEYFHLTDAQFSWADLLKKDPNTKIDLDIRPQYEPGNSVPGSYEVTYSINGAEPIERVFENG